MNDDEKSKLFKSLQTVSALNVLVWAIAIIALIILIENKGNLIGLFVILTAGVGIGIQIISLSSKLRNSGTIEKNSNS